MARKWVRLWIKRFYSFFSLLIIFWDFRAPAAAREELGLSYLLAGWRQLVRVFGQHREVINNGLQMCYLAQHGDLHVLTGEEDECNQLGRQQEPACSVFSVQRLSVTHHHRLKEVDEWTVASSFLQERPAHRLLLRLLHQQVQVADVLHGTVQLGAQVPPAWARERRRRIEVRGVNRGEERRRRRNVNR